MPSRGSYPRVALSSRSLATDKNLILALKPLKVGDVEGSSSEIAGSSSVSVTGYAIYLRETNSIADWIDLQILITGEDLAYLNQEIASRLKERGTAIFKTREQAENALFALEKSLNR